MKRWPRLLFCVLAALVFLGVANQAAAEKLEGTALEEYVIAHSPWSGDWSSFGVRHRSLGVQGGPVTYVFERVDGKFSARIKEPEDGAGATRAVGPASGVSVLGDTIHLTSAAGTRHEFKLNENGELVGKGTNRAGASETTVLKPTLKEKK